MKNGYIFKKNLLRFFFLTLASCFLFFIAVSFPSEWRTVGHKKSRWVKMNHRLWFAEIGAQKQRWVHLRFKHSFYCCVWNSYASHRPNGHLGQLRFISTAEAFSTDVFIIADLKFS